MKKKKTGKAPKGARSQSARGRKRARAGVFNRWARWVSASEEGRERGAVGRELAAVERALLRFPFRVQALCRALGGARRAQAEPNEERAARWLALSFKARHKTQSAWEPERRRERDRNKEPERACERVWRALKEAGVSLESRDANGVGFELLALRRHRSGEVSGALGLRFWASVGGGAGRSFGAASGLMEAMVSEGALDCCALLESLWPVECGAEARAAALRSAARLIKARWVEGLGGRPSPHALRGALFNAARWIEASQPEAVGASRELSSALMAADLEREAQAIARLESAALAREESLRLRESLAPEGSCARSGSKAL